MAPSYPSGAPPSGRTSSGNTKGQNTSNNHEAVNQWSSFSGQPGRPSVNPSFAGPTTTRPVTRPLHDAENSKNPGHNPHSVHYKKGFPCTYKGCNRRFDNEKSRRIHKEAEHDYCKVCDEDFDDDEALHLHKMQSEKHVICNICGIEFMSEPGRDRHAQQMHASHQNIQCRGCHKVFEKGSGLLLHFEQNACKPLQSIYMADREVLGKEMLESNRALLALQMEQIAEEEKAKKIASRSAMSMLGTDAASESEGGVRLQPSLMDEMLDEESQPDFATAGFDNDGRGKVNEFETLIEHASMHSAPKSSLQDPLIPTSARSQSDAASIASASTTATAKAWSGNYPALHPQNMNKANQNDVLAGMDKLSVSGSVKSSASGTWGNASKKLFPNAPPTPVPADLDIGNLKGIKVGEDAADSASLGPGTLMTANPIDNKFYCPFPTCETSADDMYKMVEHMQTHTGVENRCFACLRVFGSASALVAHMESASTRCNIRHTEGYRNAIHIVSGGFLGAYGRLEDGSIKLESQKKPESFW